MSTLRPVILARGPAASPGRSPPACDGAKAALRRPCVAAGPTAPPPSLPARARRSVAAAAGGSTTYGTSPAIKGTEYIVLGLANCFEKSEDGKLTPCTVVEPVSANTLESLAAGAKTSYSEVMATSAGAVAARDRSALPPAWADARFCDDWDARLGAVARTWARPHAVDNLMDIVPLGQTRAGWNTSTEDKRVLNFVNVVNDDDNIKQDISIDVYGRQSAEEKAGGGGGGGGGGVRGADAPAAAARAKAAAAEEGGRGKAPAAVPAAAPATPPAAPAAPVAEQDDDEDDLDALLNA